MIGALLMLLVAALLDEWVYATLAPSQSLHDWLDLHTRYLSARAKLESRDWYRTFRIAGTLYPWILICAAIALARMGRDRRPILRERDDNPGRALLIFLSAALSGGIAEILQMLIGRLRPDEALARDRAFKGLLERFQDTGALSFPSSHTAVAFGAAFALARFWPGPGAIALIAAAACGLTRLLAGAHYLSDVLGGALVGYACAAILIPRPRRTLLIP
jgi:membrane-associated phospholipid phosphatase